MKRKSVYMACLLGATLSACGESDLEQIHEQRLDDAIAAENSPAIGSALPEAPTRTPVDLTQYELVFSDEFQEDALDATKWASSLWSPETIIYNQLQFYVDDQSGEQTFDSPFTFDGQNLSINATATPQERLADANGQAYLSGLITTRNTFEFTYGYVEARIKVQEGRGIWPSLWMLGADINGLLPEVYLFEYDGSKPDSVFHNYNYLDSEGNLRSNGQEEIEMNGLSDAFYTVGMRWSPSELLFYVNGLPSYQITGANVPGEAMYLVLNLAMGGVWVGAPDATTPEPASLQVDYVRVYQLLGE